MNTHTKGYVAETMAKLRAYELGFVVSKPETECRYDLVLDDGKKLYRVQVKYSNQVKNGALRVKLISECRNNGYARSYDANEIDAVIAYVPSANECLWLKPELFSGSTMLSFRMNTPKNNQKSGGVRWLSDFVWNRSSTAEQTALNGKVVGANPTDSTISPP